MKQFYNSVVNGDSIVILPSFPSESIDAILTDPPFAINFGTNKNKKYNFYNRNNQEVLKGYIDVPENEYYDFNVKWLKEGYRLLKQTGNLYLVSGWSHLRDILNALYDTGFIVINHLIWKYQFGVYTKKRHTTSHYHIIYAVKNEKNYTWNKIQHYPEDVWLINRPYNPKKKKTPTSLPLKLCERMIAYSTNENDIILDPFAGSGNVIYQAIKMNRKAIGIEISKKYTDFGNERIQKIVKNKQKSFF